MRTGNTDGERVLYQTTNEAIAKLAEQHASRFVNSAVRNLINFGNPNLKKLKSIYQEAVLIAYMLWTRRTTMEVLTLSDMEHPPTFDVSDTQLKPHPLVHPDDYDDKLKGRPITLIVHPLLRVYGTDDGRDYDRARVWVPAEVWFDAQQSPGGSVHTTKSVKEPSQ
jgi:hypothetical protein